MKFKVDVIYHWMYLVTSTIVQQVGAVDSTTTQSIYEQLCVSNNRCKNGECYVLNTESKCLCGNLYEGPYCEVVNLAIIQYAIIGSVVVFHWPRPPRLNGYSFVYFEPDAEDIRFFKRNIKMADNINSIVVGNLEGARTHYRVCVEDDYTAEKALDTNSLELLSNCLDINTRPDYHTLAGWCIALLLSCVAVFFMYNQREKIEILYFNRQFVPPREVTPKNSIVNLNHNGNDTYSVNMNLNKIS